MKKPSKEVDDFIMAAKDNSVVKDIITPETIKAPNDVEHNTVSSDPVIVNSNLIDEKDFREVESLYSDQAKTFPLKLPASLHRKISEAAKISYPRLTMHSYIIFAIMEKLEKNKNN